MVNTTSKDGNQAPVSLASTYISIRSLLGSRSLRSVSLHFPLVLADGSVYLPVRVF